VSRAGSRAVACAALALTFALSGVAAAEVAGAAARPWSRISRRSFSARHLDWTQSLGELSLSGDAEVTVGSLTGSAAIAIRLKRGPRGIGVEGGRRHRFLQLRQAADHAGYSFPSPIAPAERCVESKHAVLRAGGVAVVSGCRTCGCVSPESRGLALSERGVARRRRLLLGKRRARCRSNRTKGGRRRARSTWGRFRLHQGRRPASMRAC